MHAPSIYMYNFEVWSIPTHICTHTRMQHKYANTQNKGIHTKYHVRVWEVRHVHVYNINMYMYMFTTARTHYNYIFTKKKEEEILRKKPARETHKNACTCDTCTHTNSLSLSLSNTQSNLRDVSPENMPSGSVDNLL